MCDPFAGGGAAGVLIVEDTAGTLPAAVASMDEVVLMLAHIDMPELTDISQQVSAHQPAHRHLRTH